MSLASRNRIAERTGHVRSASRRACIETGQLGDDPPQEPSSFEAWVSDIPQAHAQSEAIPPAASDGRDSALTLHATLRRRAKLARGMLIVATIGLPLVLLLNAVQASAAAHRLATQSSTSHPLMVTNRAPAPWLAGNRGADQVAGALDVQPASMNGDVVYACWVESPSGSSVPGLAPLHLAVSGDGAYTWRTLSSPVPRAAACHLVADDSDARRIVLVVQLDSVIGTGCPGSRLFASSNSGTRWSAVRLPTALVGACALSLSSASGTLVLWTNRAARPTGMTADARLWTSSDSGATWRSAGAGLPSGSVERVVSIRADGALLVLLRGAGVGPATSELWSCRAGCPEWQRVASAPGSTASVFAAPSGWQLPDGDWGTLYAANSVPAAAGSLSVASGTQPGAWQQLPPLPWSAVDRSVLSESASPSRILGVSPDGSLVLESQRAAVALASGGAMQEQAAVGVLTMWDPSARRWLTPVFVEPAASMVLAVVWDEQGANSARLTIWFETRSGDVWSMVVPSGDWQGSQVASRCQRCR